MQKLTEAKSKFNTSGVGIVSVSLLSVEAIKVHSADHILPLSAILFVNR